MDDQPNKPVFSMAFPGTPKSGHCSECREAFANLYGPQDWDNPDADEWKLYLIIEIGR
jgi:hypothetical protein